MTVLEVVKLAAENIGRQDISASLAVTSDGTDKMYADEIKSFVRCFNLVENEIALDYFPLKKEESFYPEDGVVPYAAFSSSPVDIQRVTDGMGNEVAFELRAAHLYLPEAHEKVVVAYSYAPTEKTLADDSECSGKISPRLVSFGVASEFCLTTARYQEAAVWQKRFLDALKAAKLIRRKLCVRARRWV